MRDIEKLKYKLDRKIKRQRAKVNNLHKLKEDLGCQEVTKVYNYFGGYSHGYDEGILEGLTRSLEYIEDLEENSK